MKYAVTALIFNTDGNILAVSRKNNQFDFGLPGGMVEKGEDLETAIARELTEETGLELKSLEMIFGYPADDLYVVTFLIEAKGVINTNEAGIVKWTSWEELKSGSFGKYNARLEAFLNVYPVQGYYIPYAMFNLPQINQQ